LFDEGPEDQEDIDNEEDISEDEVIDSDEDIDESEEEDTMPPTKKSSNAVKPSSKKKATTTTTNDSMTSAPFSPLLLISYKMVRYSLSNGDSFTEVLLNGSGFSDVDDFEFDLVKDGGALSFTQAIPPTFFDKAPPDHSSLSEAERKRLKNDSRTVQYADLARKIHSDLKYDINAKGPFFCQPQVIVLEKKCERIVDNKGFVSPTGHIISFNGKQHGIHSSGAGEIVLLLPVAAPLMMMVTTTTMVLPRLVTRAVYNHQHHAREEVEVEVASEEVEVKELVLALRRKAGAARAMQVSSRSPASSRK
jgi:hypothetical protein